MTLPIPASALEQHIIALGKTGAGKSSALRNLVEWLLERDRRVIVVTAKSDWWGLKLAEDGKHAGYPVVVFGGDHADMPLHHLSGKTMAELLGTGNRSAVLQMRDWMPAERTQFWIDFASNLFRLLKGKLYLVIDEVHNFAPKGKILDVKAGQMLHWSNKLAAEARGIGITLIGASQRAAKVHNDFLTSCETLIAMRVTTKWDRDAVKDWIEGCGDPEKGKEVLSSLAQMKRGDAWAWSPEVEFGPKQIHFPMFKTYDSFRPQNPADVAKLKGWADVDLTEVKKTLEFVVKEAEANDPMKLRARIRELEAAKSKAAPAPRSSDFSPSIERAKQEVSLYKNVLHEMQSYAQYLEMNLDKLRKTLSRHSEDIGHIVNRMTIEKREMPRMVRGVQPWRPPATVHQTKVSFVNTKDKKETAPSPEFTNGKLPVGEVAILKAAATFSNGIKRDELSVMSGYKKSSRDTYVFRLKQKGMLTDNGNTISITEEGLSALGADYEPLPQAGEELQRYWLGKLPKGEAVILKILIEAAGESMERERLDDATGYKKSARDTYLSRLAARRLVEPDGRGMVKASATLF